MNYTEESLKEIEKWYFDLYEKQAFNKIGSSLEEFESILSIYWGEVIVENKDDTKWVIEKYPFSPKKYELFVSKELCRVQVVNKFCDLYNKPNNKRRNLLFREYHKF